MGLRELTNPNLADISINFYNPEEDSVSDWDQFVESSPQGLPTQLSAWYKIMSTTYGHECYFLQAKIGNSIVGVLPLFFINSRITGRSLQSMPGAICASTPNIASNLINKADSLARDLKADHLFLRDSRQGWSSTNLDIIEVHRGIKLSLFEDSEVMWNNLRKDIRYHIRNGRKRGNIDILFSHDYVKDFFTTFQKFSQQMGTPVFSDTYIENILTNLGQKCQIVTAFYEHAPIAGLFNFILGKTIYGFWSGSINESRYLKVNHRLYWALIEDSCKNGYAKLDMGRSQYPSGQYKFKSQWGDEEYPIYQLFRIYRGKMPAILNPNHDQSPNNTTSLFNKIWHNLPPSVASSIGPKLRWHIPFG